MPHVILLREGNNSLGFILDSANTVGIIARNEGGSNIDLNFLSNFRGSRTDGSSTLTFQNANDSYSHSLDNSQAHTDYVLNTGDSTTGNYIFDTMDVNQIDFNDDDEIRMGGGLGNDNLIRATSGNQLQIKENDLVFPWKFNVSGYEEGGYYLGNFFSLINGNATFDTNTLFVDSTNNRVGIGTKTPSSKLHVNGTMNVTGKNSTFEQDVTIKGTLHGGSDVKIAGINITNNAFSLEENRNSSSRFTLQNLNSGENATTVIKAKNDVGGTMSIGIGSSKFMIGSKYYRNVTSLVSRSRGKTVFANFFNKAFVWLINPSDDNDADNLVEIMSVSEIGLNLSTGSIYLGDFQTSAAGGAKVVKRSNANGALFGISNPIPGANPTSGAGYVTIQDCGNYTVDAHSSLDTNNPNEVVHHLRGCLSSEIWRLSSDEDSSSFKFESGLNKPILKINKSGVIVFKNFTIGSPSSISNITMFTNPSGNPACCGVMDDMSWGCTAGVC